LSNYKTNQNLFLVMIYFIQCCGSVYSIYGSPYILYTDPDPGLKTIYGSGSESRLFYDTKTELIHYRIGMKRFHKPRLQSKQNRTFENYLQIFLRDRNIFVCSKVLRNQNKPFVFLKNDMITKPKRFKLSQGFKEKSKCFDV